MPLFRRLALSFSVLLIALLPLAAFAAESDLPLAAEQRAQLAGSRGGAFARYAFTHPGDGSRVSFELRVSPPNAGGVGFRLYGPRGEVSDRVASEPGAYVVQVHNYDPTIVADYTLVARGLPARPASAAAPPAAAPSAPTAPSPGASTPEAGAPSALTGTLAPGGREGQFALFEFDYPGDGSLYTVRLQLQPERPDVLQKAGFRLYGPRGRLLVTGGAQPGLRPNVAGDFSSREAGTYTVQVYSYADVPVGYEVALQAR